MPDNKLKHLEFIQNTIIRMSTNSFIIKGWAITIITALFAYSAKDSNNEFAYLAYFVVPFFWYLNAFFLLQERRYRALYNDIRKVDEGKIDFSMDASGYKTGKCTFICSLVGKTIWPLYLIMILIATLIIFKL